VSTREGITPVKPDDLIMRGVSGEEYPIGRAIFEQTSPLDTAPPAAPAQELQRTGRSAGTDDECTNKACARVCPALAAAAQPAPVQEPVALEEYYAGLLNDYGGGNVEWWQDYIRAELGRAYEHYQSQITTPPAQPAPVQEPVVMPANWFSGMPEEYRKEAWRVATPPAQLAAPEEIMHWDGDDGEDGPSDDIASLLNNIVSNRDLEVGEVVHITRATRLPDVWVRVTKMPEDADVEYEVIPAAPEKVGTP
jgi:hypothetical protein